jgi:Ca2+/H+ antiporter
MSDHSVIIHPAALIPFILMLLSIALFPLFWNHFWEKNKNKLIIAIILSIPVIIYLLSNHLDERLIETIV